MKMRVKLLRRGIPEIYKTSGLIDANEKDYK